MQQAKRETERAEIEAMLHQRFVAAGGTLGEWEAEKADILTDHLRQLVADAETADARARATAAERYQNF